MKTKLLLIKGLLLLLLMLAGAGKALAQTGPYPRTGDQTVCITGVAEPYGVINTSGSTYTWTVDGASSGSPNWTLTSNGSNLATILWSAPGTYRVRVVEFITATQCPGQEVFINVTVNPRPTATISGTAAVCQNAAQPVITFTGADGTAPYTFTYNINGGANQTVTTTTGNSVTVQAPTTNTGTFTYNLVSVTDANTPNCSQPQAGSAVITVVQLPTATISGTAAVCQNAAQPVITFTGANGTAPYTFTYTINGGTSQTITSTGNTATINVPTTATGEVTYTLVSVRDASGTACSQDQTGTAVITVNPLPTATISGTAAVCQNAAQPVITFTGANGTAPYTFTYTINGGTSQTITSTGNTATINVPTTATGEVTYTLVSVRDASGTACSQEQTGTAVITVNPLPTATISGTAAVCQNAAQPVVTFTGANGTAPYTFTYTINGGTSQTITSTGNTATISVPTTAAGTVTYALVSVRDASGTACSQDQTGTAVITVNALPTATIAGSVSVCQNAAQPVITFTGADGAAPYTFTYNINGGANQTVTTTAGNSVTVQALTTTTGTFTYNLTGVQDASGTTCSQAQTGSVVITVVQLPTATISGTAAVCQNAAQPVVTFTGANGTAPYTFTYTINGATSQTITSTGNTATINVPTTATGEVTYTLVSVRDASGTACSQDQTGTAVITVNALPTATISGTAAVCQNAAQPVITFTGANGTAPYTFTYTINGGTSQTITSTGNTATISVPTTAAGTVTYALVSVRDASGTACSQDQTGTAVITVNPLPTATIAGSVSVCQNAAQPVITFTGADGAAPYTFTYNINGGANQTATTTTGNSVTVQAPTTTTGTFTYNLTGVQDASGTTCSQAQTGSAVITVVQLPTATISGTAAVCQNAAQPVITFTGANGTAPYTFTYNINGGANQTVTTAAGNNSVTVAVPTTSAGTFAYNLVSVQDASATACSQPQTGSAQITVIQLPTATISGTAAVCQSAAQPVITFTGANGTAPYTFTYNINGGANQTVTTAAGNNSVTVAVPTTTAGNFTYNLVSVQDAGAAGCSQAQTGSAVVNINPLPAPVITGPNPVCQSITGTTETYSTPNVAGNTYTWTVTGGTIASGQGTNQITVTWTTPGGGSVSVTETVGSNGCSATVTNNITVQPAPVTSPIYHN